MLPLNSRPTQSTILPTDLADCPNPGVSLSPNRRPHCLGRRPLFSIFHLLSSFLLALTLTLTLLLLFRPEVAHAAGNVSTCNQASLAAALSGGGLVTFSTGNCIITVSSTIVIAANTTIDGSGQSVTLSGGNARRIIQTNAGVTLTVTNLSLVNGNATSNGGAVQAIGPLVLSNTTVISNTATGNGGGLYATSALTLTNVSVLSNTATGTNNDGGGVFAQGAANLAGSLFQNNRCTGNNCIGGGLSANSTATLTNTQFISNTADDNGGGMFINGAATINGGLFQNNRCIGGGCDGGGVSANSTATLTNTQFISNTADDNGGGMFINGAATINGGLFQNNRCTGGGCNGGGMFANSTATMTNTQFISNTTNSNGGGVYLNNNGAVTNALFARNSTTGNGEAIYVDAPGSVRIVHTTIASPTQVSGAAIYVAAGTVNITNTIVASHTTGIQRVGGTVTQNYTLFFGNTNDTSGTVGGGTGSTTGNPAFANPAIDDYHLTAASPAIDTGTNAGVTVDFEGQLRPQSSGFDRGYDEAIPVAEMAVLGSQVIADGDATPDAGDGTDFGSVLAANGAVTRTFTISNSGNATLSLTGSPAVSITGPAAGDFTVVSNPTPSIAPNNTTIFQVRFDPLVVGTRVATVTIANNDSNENPYDFAIQGVGTVPTIQFSQVTPYSSNEGVGTSVAVTLNRSGDTSFTSTAQVSLTGGTAIGGGVDYTSSGFPLTVNFGPGVTSQNVPVPIVDDLLDENTEDIAFQVTAISNAAIGAQNTAALQIVDNDNPPDLSIDDVSVSEGTGGTVNAIFTVSLSAASGLPISVDYATADNSATAPADYTAISTTPLNFAAGVITRTVIVTVQSDALDENDETFLVNLANASNATITDNQGVGTITDDDNPPSITVDDVSADETAGGAIFTVSLSAASGLDVSVDYSTTAGTATAGSDYTALSTTTLTIPAGSLTGTITVNLTDDVLDEDDETFFVNLGNPVNATLADSLGQGTILDDDASPLLTINDVSASEAAGSISFTLSLSAVSGRDVGLTYSTLDGTANSGSDYTGLPATPLTLPAGDLTATVTVSILEDFIDEADETFFVNLGSGINVTIGDNLGQGTILDNDTAGVTVTPTSLTIGEPNGSDTFTIALTSEPTATVTITLNSSDPTECTVPASVNLTSLNWQAGASVTVTAVDDQISDGPQLCTVETTAGSGDPIYNGRDVDDVSVTVTDDDVPGVTISTDSISLEEGGATAQYTIQLNTIPTATVTIAFNTGSQLEPIANLTFPASPAALNPQTVTVAASDDTIVEGDHSGLISHTASGGGYDSASIPNVNAAITDNDIAYTLAANQASVTEGNSGTSPISFTVTRTGDITRSSTVDFSLGGTASNSADYNNVAPAPGVLSFSTGQTSRNITLDVLGDFIVEGNETISLNLSNATGTNGSGTGTVSGSPAETTILDDDSAGIIVNPTELTITEPNGTDTFNIRLTSEPTATVTIALSSNDLTECTVPTPASLDNLNWQTGVTVTVAAVDDLIADGAQLCQVITAAANSNDPNYNGRNPGDVMVIVNDNDLAGVTITPTSGLTTTEAGGPATFTVVLNTEPTASVSLPLTSTDSSEGTASPAGLIFTPLNWNVPQTVTLSGVNDAVDDGDIAYTIQTGPASSSDSSYDNFDPADVAVTNLDDDSAGFIVSASSGNTSESGQPATFTIRLASQPVAEVIVPIASSDPTEGTVSPTNLIFTPLDWSVPQTVTVTGVDDFILDGNIAYTIQTNPTTNSADLLYNQQTPVNVPVVNLDNEAAAPEAIQIYLPLIFVNTDSGPDLVVDSLNANGSNVSLTIRNIGNVPVVDAFWVDVYLNPTIAPTHVNQRWQDVGTQGLVWGVKGAALPLDPGETLSLTIGDAYYFANLSRFVAPLAQSSPVYAQVDSVNMLTNYGGVREGHEINGGPYNNIAQTVAAAEVSPTTAGSEALPDQTASLPPR